MKKLLFTLVLFCMLPLFVHAATLTTGIDVDGIGPLSMSRNTYNLTLYTKLDYSTIKVSVVEGSTVTITDGNGNVVEDERVPIVEGTNAIKIVVSNGTSSETWNINITRDSETEYQTDQDGNPTTGSFISMVSMGGLSGIGMVMYLYSKNKLLKKV